MIVENREFLIVRDRHGPSVQDVICSMIRSYPVARFEIVEGNPQRVQQLQTAIGMQVSRHSEVEDEAEFKDEDLRGGVSIGTAYSGHNRHEWIHANFIILPNARTALQDRVRFPLHYSSWRPRIIGFIEREEKFSAWEMDWLTAIFGFSRIELPSDIHRLGSLEPAQIIERYRDSKIRNFQEFLRLRPQDGHDE